MMANLKEIFPTDLDYGVALDTTRSVTEGFHEIVLTLAIAMILVIIVVFGFLVFGDHRHLGAPVRL